MRQHFTSSEKFLNSLCCFQFLEYHTCYDYCASPDLTIFALWLFHNTKENTVIFAIFLPYELFWENKFLLQDSYISCTLRSRLHEIPTVIRTFPHALENNHACKWTSDNFPGMLTYVLFLENCQKTICLHGYSPIHVNRS